MSDVLPTDVIKRAYLLVSEHIVFLGTLTTEITIRVYRRIPEGDFEFRLSHFVKTPVQADPYFTNVLWGETEERALQRAVTTLTLFYVDAVKAGHEPNEGWLVKNPSWRNA